MCLQYRCPVKILFQDKMYSEQWASSLLLKNNVNGDIEIVTWESLEVECVKGKNVGEYLTIVEKFW